MAEGRLREKEENFIKLLQLLLKFCFEIQVLVHILVHTYIKQIGISKYFE